MSLKDELARALERVRSATKIKGGNVIPSKELKRADRELLLRTHWLEPIIKGWYMLVKPDSMPGESSYWYANFWKFVAMYLESHFGKDYCLSAENSLDIHIGSPTIPEQVIVIVKKGGGAPVKLPFQTSIFPYKDPNNLPQERVEKQGLQIMELGYALCRVVPTYFQKQAQNAEIALRLIRSSEELLNPILEHGFKSAAARLIGAYYFLGDIGMTHQLQGSLKTLGVKVEPENPFQHTTPSTSERFHSPYAARILSLWNSYRKKNNRALSATSLSSQR